MELKDKATEAWKMIKREMLPLTEERRKIIVARLKKEKHKEGVNPDDWDHVNSKLIQVAEFDLDLCQALKLPVEYTSIIRPMISVSTTDIHAQKRAYDRTLRGWPKGVAAWFAELVNDGLNVGAVSRSDGKQRESVFETDEFKKDAKGDFVLDKAGNKIQIKWQHLHFQCST